MPTLDYATRHLDQDEHSDTLHARIREILREGRWVSAEELVSHIGHRFAAALHMVRYGLDGRTPMDIEGQRMPGSHMYRYRWTGKYSQPQPRQRCEKCGHMLKKRRTQ